jgi:hypothetical protein
MEWRADPGAVPGVPHRGTFTPSYIAKYNDYPLGGLR